MERYKDLVFSIPLRYGAPQQDAADIFQAVWFDLFNELPPPDGEPAAAQWQHRRDDASRAARRRVRLARLLRLVEEEMRRVEDATFPAGRRAGPAKGV